MTYKQQAPFAVQIELSEGCNLRCAFCGINGIRSDKRKYKFMTVKTAERIASQMAEQGWTARIEFAMHGEPTMNPDMVEIVAVFRKHLPKASLLMLSNGGGLVDEPHGKIPALFDAGLNTLGLDEYQNVKLVPKILKRITESIVGGNFSFYVYPDNPDGNPHKRMASSKQRLVHIRPIDVSTKGTHSSLNNHAGSGAPKNDNGAGKPCAKPFRELSFRWDGSTAICCNDWRGELATGSIHDEGGLMAIWHGKVMDAARRRLITGDRAFGPCQGCDAKSYRTGLLPDKLGKDEMPAPTKKTNKLLKKAAEKKQLTKTVKRGWEK